MTKESFYDLITEQYYEFIASLKKLSALEIVQKAELISNTKQLYKYITSNKPFSDDNIEFLSKLDSPLEAIAETFTDIYGINTAGLDRLMFEAKSLGLFE